MNSCMLSLDAPVSIRPKSDSVGDNPHRQHRKRTISLLKESSNFNQIASIHAYILKNGQNRDDFITFELLRACFKFDAIDYALTIFRQTHEPNVYIFTALVDGLVLSGRYYDGIRAYVQMVENFLRPDGFVSCSVLKACGLGLDLRMGGEIHAQSLKLGLCSNRSVRLKLLELYGKCGELNSMKKVFDEMPERDTVAMTIMISAYIDHNFVENAFHIFKFVDEKDTICWTTMIDGLVRNGQFKKALEFFRQMQKEEVRANEVTVVCILSACAQLGALELGKWIHSYIDKYKLEVNPFVGSALITMYSKCGSIEEAETVFNHMIDREVSTYNSMIAGFALNGKSLEAVEMFLGMMKNGTRPTSATFVGVLNACSHGGLVEIGFKVFRSMQPNHGIEPQIEHYGCMVDLLGRAGHTKEAYRFAQNMKVTPDHVIWGSLLSSCNIHGDYEVGERVAKILLSHECADTGTYALVSNFSSSQGRWEEALSARAKLKDAGMKKEPGCSSIEVNDEVHEFLLGDIRHPERKAIYRKLEEMDEKVRLEGYCPQVDGVAQDILDQEKELALSIHSERLAICYGLISTKPYSAIRIVKNLRICNDCHAMIKLISRITGRRIVVRDRSRFHHFENGSCTCGDHW